jgi:hypothetical protein
LYTTDTYQVYIGDGVTAGGRPLYTLTSLGAIGLTDLSATSPLFYNNTTGVFSIQVATGSQNGYLASGDFTAFTNKQTALEIFDETTSIVTNPSQIKFVGSPVTATVAGSVVTVTISGTGGGGGGVTGVSVATANGFSGVSDSNATNPTLTLATTVTGLLKGNGTAVSAATAGTDYQAALTGTGLVNSSGGTITYVTNNSSNWDTAYSQRISSFTTTGNSGAATFTSNVLNIPNYTAAGIGAIASSRVIGTTAPLQGGGDLTADRTLSILQATTSQSGFLSSTDWNTFFNKQAALSGTGIVKSTAGTITYLTDNSANWDTAFGWGNHASAGYLTTATAATTYVPRTRTLTIDGVSQDLTVDRSFTINKSLNDLTDVTISSIAGGDLLQYNGVLTQWVNTPISALISVGADNGLSFLSGNVVLGGALDNDTTINTFNTSQYSLTFTAGSTAYSSPGTAPIRITETTANAAGRSALYVGANDNHAIVAEGKGVPITTSPAILYRFTITSATVSNAAVYTNNGQTFTVLGAITASTTLFAYSTGTPTNTGTLTLTGGSGTSPITFSRYQIIESVYNRTTANLTTNAALFAKARQGLGLYVCSQPDETFTHSSTYIAPSIPAALIEKTTGVRSTFVDSFSSNTIYNLLALRLTNNSGATSFAGQGVSMTFEATSSHTSATPLTTVETLGELRAYAGGIGVIGSTFEIRTKNTNKELTPNIQISGENNTINLPSYRAFSPPILFTIGGTGDITAIRNKFPFNGFPLTGVYSYENRDFYAIRIATPFTGGGTGFSGTPVIGWNVTSIKITNSGSGYVTAPAVTVSGGTLFVGGPVGGVTLTGGTALTATATLTSGRVTSITFSGGSRYTVPPILTIAAPPSGVTATAEVVLNGEFLTATISNGGAGYSDTRDTIYVIDTRNDVSNDNTQIGALLALNASGDIVKTKGLLSLDYILNATSANPSNAIFGSGGVLLSNSTINATSGLNIDGTNLTIGTSNTNINGTTVNINPATLNIGPTALNGLVTGITVLNFRGGYTITSDQNTGTVQGVNDLNITANAHPTSPTGTERLRITSVGKVFIYDVSTPTLAGGEVFTMVNKVTGEVGYTTLATVATSGNYGDLGGLPTLGTVAATNDYNDLDNLPAFATVATSGAYADLTGTPTIPTTLDSLTDVSAASPTNGQVLAYNTGASAWQAVTFSASGLTLRTNTVANPTQNILDLKQGTNITIVDDGLGGVTINSSGGSGGVGLDSVFMLMGA